MRVSAWAQTHRGSWEAERHAAAGCGRRWPTSNRLVTVDVKPPKALWMSDRSLPRPWPATGRSLRELQGSPGAGCPAQAALALQMLLETSGRAARDCGEGWGRAGVCGGTCDRVGAG